MLEASPPGTYMITASDEISGLRRMTKSFWRIAQADVRGSPVGGIVRQRGTL